MGKQLVGIISEICREENIGFTEFSDGYIIRLEANNRSMYIIANKFPNNPASVEQICNDKAAVSEILGSYGIPRVEHIYIPSPALTDFCPEGGCWDRMKALLAQYGSLVLKNNRGTGGNEVYKVSSQKELEATALALFKSSSSLCVSPYREIKNEYRVLVIGNEVQYIFRKIRPFVTGNGTDPVYRLWEENTGMSFDFSKGGTDPLYIPRQGEKCELSWKHNLGQGATPENVTDGELIKRLTSLAQRCVSALNLGFVSIDIVDIGGELNVLEINSGVMIENYSKSSPENYLRVKSAIKKAVFSYLHLDTKYALVNNKKNYYVMPILFGLAKEKGVTVTEDKNGMNFAVFTFKNGKSFAARDYPFNINSSGSSNLCANKSACNAFLSEMGYSVPREKFVVRKSDISESLDEVERIVNEETDGDFRLPLIVKPNDRSQGDAVFLARTVEECVKAAREVFSKSKIALIQECCVGDEYRIVVLDSEIIQAYRRVPFGVSGDGVHTVSELIHLKREYFRKYDRDKDIDPDDPRIFSHITEAGYTPDTVLENGVRLRLQDIANLSLGGESQDALDILGAGFRDMAVGISKKLNLKMCGIDLIADDITDFDKKYRILEINSAPGLDNYLYADREKQDLYVKELYEKVLDALGK